jgi:hypothetical protein
MVSIVNVSGSTIPNLVVNDIKVTKVTRAVILDIPTANKDVLQVIGNKNRRFVLSGWAIQSGSSSQPLIDAQSNLEALMGNTGSISSNILPVTQVLFLNVEVGDKGGRPLEFTFSIDAVEVI